MAEQRNDSVEIRRGPAWRHEPPVPSTAAAVSGWGATVRRISWGAILAGVVVALVSQLLLGLLGLGLGLGAVDLTGARVDGGDGGIGIPLAVGIWWGVTALISLFLGGFVAGRLAGVPRNPDGLLHGIVMWGVATLVSVYLLTNIVGGIVGGAVSVVTDTLALAGRGVAEAATAGAEAAAGEVREGDATLAAVKDEARQILRETGRPALQPEALEREAQRAADTLAAAAGRAATSPQEAEAELSAALDRLAARAGRVVSAADREAVANVLVARTDMTREEAMRTVRGWEDRLQSAAGAVTGAASEVEEGAVEFADAAAGTLSEASLWAFIALMLGMAAAALGGFIGTPPPLAVTEARAETA